MQKSILLSLVLMTAASQAATTQEVVAPKKKTKSKRDIKIEEARKKRKKYRTKITKEIDNRETFEIENADSGDVHEYFSNH